MSPSIPDPGFKIVQRRENELVPGYYKFWEEN